MFDKKLVIISNYPNSDEIKDGMMQRVANIDDYMADKQRIYLGISLKRNILKKSEKIKNELFEYRINIFIHYLLIFKILKNSKTIYVHSVYNFLKLLPFMIFLKNKNLILDFHGVVPEELKYMKKYLKSILFTYVEKRAVRYASHIIFVTESMKIYISGKYKSAKYNAHVLNIFSKNVFRAVNTDELDSLRDKYKINEDDVVFIYSGNTQKWQNIDLMLSCINKIKNVKNYKFIILTGELEIIKNKLEEFSLLEQNNIIIDTVSPEELGNFYSIAHYGFVLRDEHILNNVANPTKIVEYMYYGIVPIVKSENLGDYKALDYEFIKYENINSKMQQKKSIKNIEIIKNISSNVFNLGTIL